MCIPVIVESVPSLHFVLMCVFVDASSSSAALGVFSQRSQLHFDGSEFFLFSSLFSLSLRPSLMLSTMA